MGHRRLLALVVALGLVSGAGPGITAEKVTVGLTSLSPAAMPIFVARDKGFFEAEGLEVTTPVFKSGTENTQAVIAGEVHIAFGSITEVLNLRKAKLDGRYFWGISNFMPFKLYAHPSIKSPLELKGKKLAISNFGAQSDYLTQFTLRHFGVEPIKEAAILPIGSTPARYAALKSGRVDATIMWFPHTLIAEKDGFKMLVDLNDLIPDWGYLGYYAKIEYLKSRRETVLRYLRAHTRAIREVNANPQLGIEMLKKHLKYDQAVAEAGYKEFVKSFAADGRLPVKGFEFLLAEEEKAGKLKEKLAVADLIEEEFVKTFRGTR
ncbi:MAG: ABC transporter substrate-binding protein [Candidatus Rokubacteria bacterium]|nr:ABC transporter substrate-binding protein [Candidatus Rokubacteria bacterium]